MATELDLAASPGLGGEHSRPLRARLVERLVAERERWPLWLPVLLGAGIGG
jgi:hypothetical protein